MPKIIVTYIYIHNLFNHSIIHLLNKPFDVLTGTRWCLYQEDYPSSDLRNLRRACGSRTVQHGCRKVGRLPCRTGHLGSNTLLHYTIICNVYKLKFSIVLFGCKSLSSLTIIYGLYWFRSLHTSLLLYYSSRAVMQTL